MIFPDSESPVANLSSLTWIFPTLWWVDGVGLNEFAEPVYRMGDENYVFNEEVCASYFDDGNHRALTYFFDVSVIETTELFHENVATVLDHFVSAILSSSVAESTDDVSVYPNPAVDRFTFQIEGFSLGPELILSDLSGRTVHKWFVDENVNSVVYNVPENVQSGLYLLSAKSEDRSIVRRLQIQR